MSTVGVVFLVGAVGAMGFAQRAELERLPLVRHYVLEVGHESAPVATEHVAAPVAVHPPPASSVAVFRSQPAAHHTAPTAMPIAPAHPAPAAKVGDAAVHSDPAGVVSKSASASEAAKAELAQFDAFHSARPEKSDVPALNAGPPVAHPAQGQAAGKEASSSPPVIATKTAVEATAKGSAAHPGVAIASVEHVQSSPAASAAMTAASQPKQPAAEASKAPAVLMVHPTEAQSQPNPVAQAVSLQAAPMTAQQQLDVVHLVTELGVLIRDQKTEIAVLHSQVSSLSGTVNGKLTDFDRRLSLAEANGAIAAAMGASVPQHSAGNETPPRPTPHQEAPAAKPVALPPEPPAVKRSVSDYHIQAASPGLAMLSVAGGGSIEVATGDEVPGVGRVKAVGQQGTAWEIETDHGIIR